MTLLIVLTVLIAIAAYLAIGLGYVAPRWAARQVETDIRDYAILARKPGQIEKWRRSAAGSSIDIALVWPGYLVWRWLTDRIMKAAPPSSLELEELAKRQAERIAELENELGIGRSTRP